MAKPVDDLVVRALQEDVKAWKARAEHHAAEERSWRIACAGLLRQRAEPIAVLSEVVLKRIAEEGWSIERVVDADRHEVLVRLYKEADERPPEPPHEPGEHESPPVKKAYADEQKGTPCATDFPGDKDRDARRPA